MCTLTYRLTESGYELFFNRDEQRTRAQAIAPKVDASLGAIYPVDPLGKGTWLAVDKSGLCLALLNYYQAEIKNSDVNFTSRGEIILQLLAKGGDVVDCLKEMGLAQYQPFQLCVFPADLNIINNQLRFLQWDGEHLTEQTPSAFFTSSGVDYPQVYQARKVLYEQIVSASNPTTEQLLRFHHAQQNDGKLSVKMCREDAQTVSFSHIVVNEEIKFNYIDYLDDKHNISCLNRS